MKIFNRWVGYLDRSHLTIKDSVLKKLAKTNPEMTDHSESNILVIIVSIFSGIAEQLNYYIDSMAREAFITTARKYTSVVKHTRLIDYRIKAAVPSSVDILVKLLDQNGNTFQTTQPLIIPINTQFSTANGVTFITTTDKVVVPGTSIISLQAQQKNFRGNINLGVTQGIKDEKLNIGVDYVDNSLVLNIAGQPWELVESLGFSGPNSKHYIVDISPEGMAYVQFGDGINGEIPMGNQTVYVDYYTTLGAKGNVDANTIIATTFDFTITGANRVEINNPLRSVGGNGYQDIEQIRRAAPLSLRTLDKGVTKQDYIDIAKLAPGVDKSDVKFDCNTGIHVYISPLGGGIAQTALIQNTHNFIEERKIIGRPIRVQAAGESYIKLNIDVTLKKRRDKNQARQDIIQALITNFGYENSDVNKAVRKSDIYATVDNLEKVDFLNINKIYTQPYFRPLGHLSQILGTIEINDNSLIDQVWKLKYVETISNNYFNLYKNNILVGIIDIGINFSEPTLNVFSINIQPSNYENGQEWEFRTLPINIDQLIADNSIPIIREQDLIIQIHEQF